ncbi:MAG: hypothetical protein HZY75_01520 [Nocardioidaceae bacterium]|nr:MAG: hypothetical protein HZY75_01520 [Nocardioidaceae bacterium]
METRSHIAEFNAVVRLARKAQSVPHLRNPASLANFLYHRWYLGQPIPWPARTLPVQRRGPRSSGNLWRSWGGPEQEPAPAGGELARLQLACAPHTALHAITVTTRHADSWGVWWRLTSSAAGAPISAADATILFLRVADVDAVLPAVAELATAVRPFLSHARTPLTWNLASGISLVQNPPDDADFGRHRCNLIAQAVTANAQETQQDQVAAVLRAFEARGIDPTRPYVHDADRWDLCLVTA